MAVLIQHLLTNPSLARLPHLKTMIKEREYFEDSKNKTEFYLISFYENDPAAKITVICKVQFLKTN